MQPGAGTIAHAIDRVNQIDTGRKTLRIVDHCQNIGLDTKVCEQQEKPRA